MQARPTSKQPTPRPCPDAPSFDNSSNGKELRHGNGEANAGGSLTEPPLVRRVSEKAPRSIHSKNQGFVELGAWKIKRLRQAPTFKVSPWNAPETGQEHPSGTPCVNRDPLALAKFYKGLLDSGTVENRAALARYLGVSRSRVTQVLRRLEKAPKSATHNNDAAGRNGKPGKEDSHAEG